MADETSNIVLEHLRHIRAAVDDIRAEMRHFIMRMGLAERNIVSLHVSDGWTVSNGASSLLAGERAVAPGAGLRL
jgi:hypothetical protein